MTYRLRVAAVLVRLAEGKLGGAEALQKKLATYVEQLATGATAQALGGRAAAARLTAEARQARARAVANARWGKK